MFSFVVAVVVVFVVVVFANKVVGSGMVLQIRVFLAGLLRSALHNVSNTAANSIDLHIFPITCIAVISLTRFAYGYV